TVRTRAPNRGTSIAMRSFPFAIALLASACAVGTDGNGDTTPVEDAGNVKDAAPVTQKDSSAPPPQDSGTQQQDVSQPPPDSGNTQTGCTFQGVLATYDFTGEPGNQASTKATTMAKNVTAGAIARATSLTATTGVDS